MTRFPVFGLHFPVLEHHFPVLERPFLLCPVLSRVPSRILAVPARPEFGCPGPSHPLARFLPCPVVPLSWDDEGNSVPLSRKVALFRPVGNPILDAMDELLISDTNLKRNLICGMWAVNYFNLLVSRLHLYCNN